MYYDNIVVIGNGKVACDVCEILFNKGIKVKVFESQYSSISMLKGKCNQYGFDYCVFPNKEETMSQITDTTTDGNTLIISANNEYIFPKSLCDSEKCKIINFHYSFLPDYRGMNIPTWVIFNNESCTGVTWHFVNSKIDDGSIIIQEKIQITEKTRAIDIVKEGMDKGVLLFDRIVDDLLDNNIVAKPQSDNLNLRSYRRSVLPDDGILNTMNDEHAISRILRAFDYGPFGYIPKLKIKKDDNYYDIKKYRIYKSDELIVGIECWKEDIVISGAEYKFEIKI